MPIYEYQATEDSCVHCHEPFEVFQKMSDDPLSVCPECGEAVQRILSAFAVSGGDPLSQSRLEAAGFTQYKRNGKGNYEKTAGKGPAAIVDGQA